MLCCVTGKALQFAENKEPGVIITLSSDGGNGKDHVPDEMEVVLSVR